VKARNQRIKAASRLYQKTMEAEMKKYFEKLSGMTENQSTEEVSGPVQ
jgi:hypothetical protein